MYAKLQTHEDSLRSFPLCKLRCSKITPVQKVGVNPSSHHLTQWCSSRVGKYPKLSREYQIPSLLGPDDMIFLTRRWQLYMRNTAWGNLPSLSPACCAARHFIVQALLLYADICFCCEAHCMEWSQRHILLLLWTCKKKLNWGGCRRRRK